MKLALVLVLVFVFVACRLAQDERRINILESDVKPIVRGGVRVIDIDGTQWITVITPIQPGDAYGMTENLP